MKLEYLKNALNVDMGQFLKLASDFETVTDTTIEISFKTSGECSLKVRDNRSPLKTVLPFGSLLDMANHFLEIVHGED